MGFRMRREKPQRNIAKKIFVILWKTCIECGYEFRFERMWRSFYGAEEYSICGDCGSSQSKANSIAVEYHTRRRNERSKTPSPPKGGSGQSPREKEA
jgi:DNA-directed RNA polymerase subunit M/transcription elongation factor TFIIS